MDQLARARSLLFANDGANRDSIGPVDDRMVEAHLMEWRIALSVDSVPEGSIHFEVANAGTHTHSFVISGDGFYLHKQLEPGATEKFVATLAPGTYSVACKITDNGIDHHIRGMHATLEVVSR